MGKNDPTRFFYHGNPADCEQRIGLAKNVLFKLTEMQDTGSFQNKLSRGFVDGTAVVVDTSVKGINLIHIYPPSLQEKKKGGIKKESIERIVPVLAEITDITNPPRSLCSWSSPKFSGFQYFFKEPPYPMYSLIQPEPKEITLREFKFYDNGSNGVSATDTPGDLVVEGEGSEGDPQEGSSGGTETTVYKIVTPDGDVLKTVTRSISNNVSWSQWLQWDGEWCWRFVTRSEANVSISGGMLEGLSYSYISDTGDFACIYIQSAVQGDYHDDAWPKTWEDNWGSGLALPLFDAEVFTVYNAGDFVTTTNELRLLTRINGVISDIALPPEWDDDSEWEVSQGFVTIYKEKVVVYSYLKTEVQVGE